MSGMQIQHSVGDLSLHNGMLGFREQIYPSDDPLHLIKAIGETDTQQCEWGSQSWK